MMSRPACQKDSMVSPMMMMMTMLPNVKSKSRHSQSSCLGFGFVTQASGSGFLCRHSVYGINMLIAWDPGGLIDVATHVVHYSNTFLILNPLMPAADALEPLPKIIVSCVRAPHCVTLRSRKNMCGMLLAGQG